MPTLRNGRRISINKTCKSVYFLYKPSKEMNLGALPFVVAMLVCLALILAFPQIAVWLVSTADFT